MSFGIKSGEEDFRIHCSVSYNTNVCLKSAASNVGHFFSPLPAVLLLQEALWCPVLLTLSILTMSTMSRRAEVHLWKEAVRVLMNWVWFSLSLRRGSRISLGLG